MTEAVTRASPPPSFRREIIAQLPSLRAFAISLCGNRDRADDLVQDTILRAWAAHTSFTEGGNIRAWLFTILRNAYFGELRKRRREVADSDGFHAATLVSSGGQEAHLEFGEFKEALARMPPDQREVLILIGASGFSYEEAAEITGVAIGTIKSRLNRAREKLAHMLSIGGAEDIGPGAVELSSTQMLTRV